MTWFLIKLLVRVAAFGVAIAFVIRRNPGVKVAPRKALPLVALVFALMNTLLYWLVGPVVGTVLTLMTFGLGALLVPFFVNGAFLYATSRLVGAFRVSGLMPFVHAAFVVTLVHIALRLLHL